MEKIVIFDAGAPELGDRIFDKNFTETISHTFLPLCYLYDEAKKNNISFISPSLFLKNKEVFNNDDVFLISHLVNQNTEKLIKLGVKPLLLTCQESPFIATRFYINLKKYTSCFKYSMLFPGMEKRVSNKTIFIPMYFPQFFSNENHTPLLFSEKKFITYIASNKEVKSLLKVIVIKLLYGFNIKMIYSFR